jgi:hypothetical protein
MPCQGCFFSWVFKLAVGLVFLSSIQSISSLHYIIFAMQYKALATLFFAATALAAPADSTSTSSSPEFVDSNDLYDDYLEDIYDDIYEAVPSSILTVLATAIPATWYNDLFDSASRDSIVSEAMAGTYPAWYNSLPSSVKAWATNEAFIGISATATQTETADGSTFKTGSTAAASQTSFASETSVASQTPAKTTSASTTPSSSSSQSTSESSSESSSDSSSSSASSSPSPSQSTGGAPAPTGGITMGVAGAAGVLALALAL